MHIDNNGQEFLHCSFFIAGSSKTWRKSNKTKQNKTKQTIILGHDVSIFRNSIGKSAFPKTLANVIIIITTKIKTKTKNKNKNKNKNRTSCLRKKVRLIPPNKIFRALCVLAFLSAKSTLKINIDQL